jgi:hypothetical protein
MKTQVNIMMDISLTMSRLTGKSLSDWYVSDFKKVYSKNSLDELKILNQLGSVEKYWYQFEKLRYWKEDNFRRESSLMPSLVG